MKSRATRRMRANLAQKRKLEDDDALETATKSQKLVEEDEHEDEEHPHAYTRLPPEILLDIFDYLKPEDYCMKKLSEVCKKFYNLCSPRLRVLQLNFNKINSGSYHPVIRRAYSEIIIFGAEIDCNREEIAKVLESSEKSARKLVISNNHKSQKRAIIKMRSLMSILRSLPKLKEVEITAVNGLMPQFSTKAIKPNEMPKLRYLRKLTLKNVPAIICLAFHKASYIFTLKLEITSLRDMKDFDAYNLLILAQEGEVRKFHLELNNSIRSQSDRASLGGNDIEELLERFPKLEHIKLNPRRKVITQALLTAGGPPVKSVKTIFLVDYIVERFDIDEVRKKFPSLRSFKGYGLNWSITSAEQSTDKKII